MGPRRHPGRRPAARLREGGLPDQRREKFGITLDLTDIPRDQFVVARLGRRQYRAGKDGPNRYGLSAVNGIKL